MTDGAHAALAAVEATDLDALNEAGATLVASCEGCHDVFKSEVPTEGIMHIPHYDSAVTGRPPGCERLGWASWSLLLESAPA